MDHPIIGKLESARDGSWGVRLSLPAFQPCYERWNGRGGERPDTRDDEEKAGRFWASFATATPGTRDHPVEAGPPSDAQVAAVVYLREHQDRVALALGEALAREAPERFHWEYIVEDLPDEDREMFATPEGIMQTVELQGLVIALAEEDGCAKVGFSFHSELLEPEHGVAVVMHRDRPVLVGTWDELMELEYTPGEDDYGMGD